MKKVVLIEKFKSKKCSTCALVKPIDFFYLKNKMIKSEYRPSCKECIKIKKKEWRLKNIYRIKEYNTEYRKQNSDKIKNINNNWYKNNKEKAKNWNKNNKQKIKISSKKYYDKNKVTLKLKAKNKYNNDKNKFKVKNKKWRINNSEKVKKIAKNWRLKNPNYSSEYSKKRKKNDILYKVKISIKNNIRNGIKNRGYFKNNKTQNILGCTVEKFKIYIENQFSTWMSWENYGKYNGEINFGWDLDHIIPISSAKNEEDVIRLNHYTNFQPLCSKTNRVDKRNKLNS